MNELPNGSFLAEITLEGGSGRAKIQSPAPIHIEDGKITATLTWSSSSYDYMEIGGVGYTSKIVDGKAVFEVEIPALDTPLDIKAETVAMSEPHMIDYVLTVSGEEIKLTGSEQNSSPESFASSVQSDNDSTGSDVVSSAENSSESVSGTISVNSYESVVSSSELFSSTSENVQSSTEYISTAAAEQVSSNGSAVGFVAIGAGAVVLVAAVIAIIIGKVRK